MPQPFPAEVHMSNSIRKEMRRQLEGCRKHTSAIEYYLAQHQEIAEAQHPEIAEQIQVIRQTNLLLDQLLEQLRDLL